MSVRPPTSQRKTGPYSSVAEKIKALKERKKKLNPFSPTNKKITQQIKKLEQSQKSVSQKFKYTGKEIGDNKTKTGQYEEKAPKVKTPIFKLKGDASERRRKKRLAEEKANREKVRLAKGRKASEKLQDIPPVSKPKKKVVAAKKKPRTFKDPYKDQEDRKLGTAVPVKTPVSKVIDKPKTKDMSIWETIKKDVLKGLKNIQADPRSRSQQVQQSTAAALNKKMKEVPTYVKNMKEYKQIGDMLKARQVTTDKDIASGRDAEARRKAAKAKQQASRAKTRTGTFKDLYKGKPKKPATAVSKARTFKDPYKDQEDRKLGTAVPVKTPVRKKVVKPVSKKVAPSKLANVTSRRKPIPPKTKTFTDPYKDQEDRKLGTGIPKARTFKDPYKGKPKKPSYRNCI